MGNTLEILFVVIAMSFWVLFPIGIFLSVSKLDKNTDQVIRLEHLRHEPVESERDARGRVIVRHFDWHHPVIYFRNWLQHE